MVVHQYSQLMAAAHSTALEDSLAILSGHALPETMHTHSPTDLRLICPLRHYTFLSITQNLKLKKGYYTARVPPGQSTTGAISAEKYPSALALPVEYPVGKKVLPAKRCLQGL